MHVVMETLLGSYVSSPVVERGTEDTPPHLHLRLRHVNTQQQM